MAAVRVATFGPIEVLGCVTVLGAAWTWFFVRLPGDDVRAVQSCCLNAGTIAGWFAGLDGFSPAEVWPGQRVGDWDSARAVREIEDAALAAGEVNFHALGFELVRDESPRWIMVRRQ